MFDIRWLSRAKAQAHFQETMGGTSSVVAAVLGDAAFGRVCRSGVHLLGRRYEVEAFEEARPDAFCSRCSRWDHIGPHCSQSPRCAICAEDHPTHNHQCSVEGCKAGRGHGCTHVTTQCTNCRDPRGARADACAAKKEARQLAWGWKSPPRPGAGIMAVWQVALVKQLRIMGSNPSQPHILAEGRRKAEDWRKAMGGRTGFSAP